MVENRYQVINLIGEGRTGGVYAAEDSKLNRKVAIRRFFNGENQFDFESCKEEFGEVARSLSNFQHPNVLKIFDVGTDEEGAYIVSQLLDGESLHEALKRGQFDSHEVFEIATQMLDAFTQIHEQGYYREYLAIDSIMMTSQNRGGYSYIIIDMGLAKIFSLLSKDDPSTKKILRDNTILAPELLEGKEADAGTDLYMLGQILYMTLAGGHPYANLKPKELKAKHAEGLPPISNFNAYVPEDFAVWLSKLTAVNPAERYVSAAEALNELPVIEPDAQKIATQLTQVATGGNEETVTAQTGTVQANPIKKVETQPVLTRASAPVPISAPGAQHSGLVATTIPTVSAPVAGVYPETSSQAVSGLNTQGMEKKSPVGLWITLGAVGVLAAILGIYMLTRDSEDLTYVAEVQYDPKVVTHFEGLGERDGSWIQKLPSFQAAEAYHKGWVVRDQRDSISPGLKFPLKGYVKAMYAKGWKLTYKIKVGMGNHRFGFVLDDDLNTEWGKGVVSCCLGFRRTQDGIYIYSSQNESYHTTSKTEHYARSPIGRSEWATITIEQEPKASSGEFVVKLNGEEIFRDRLTRDVRYKEHEYWSNHLFSSSLGVHSRGSWIIGDMIFEIL